jgi:hypothetical protein
MTGQQPWEDLNQARDAYFAVARAMVADGTWEQQMRLALGSPRGRATALRALRGSPTERVMDLLDPVFLAAISLDTDPGPAIDVLGRLDPGWLAGSLRPLVTRRLDDPHAPAAEHRQLVALLDALDQPALLAEVSRRLATPDPPGDGAG